MGSHLWVTGMVSSLPTHQHLRIISQGRFLRYLGILNTVIIVHVNEIVYPNFHLSILQVSKLIYYHYYHFIIVQRETFLCSDLRSFGITC